jgi:hypothetical protein
MPRFALLLTLSLAACGGGSPSSPDAQHTDARSDAVDPPPHRCDFADCEGGFARTCNTDPQVLDCTAFGASCGAFTDAESGAPFNWCSCGELEEGEGFCSSGRYGVTCFDGLGGLADCGAGYACVERPAGPFGIGCECDNIPDGLCPGLDCSSDPDCDTCTPSCSGRSCGDNGCGGECGTCDFGDECNAQGRCETICVPDCDGKQCGDDGCGGSCGTCSDGACTSAGTCEGPCVASCTGATCGDDGCGGSCGSCSDGLSCTSARTCGCGFFETVKYNFTLAPQSSFPANFSFIGLNVRHINLDGSTGTPNGAFMGFRASDKQMFTLTASGCRPKIKIKVEYALSGIACMREEIIEGRTDFVLPAPIVSGSSCTVPAL